MTTTNTTKPSTLEVLEVCRATINRLCQGNNAKASSVQGTLDIILAAIDREEQLPVENPALVMLKNLVHFEDQRRVVCLGSLSTATRRLIAQLEGKQMPEGSDEAAAAAIADEQSLHMLLHDLAAMIPVAPIMDDDDLRDLHRRVLAARDAMDLKHVGDWTWAELAKEQALAGNIDKFIRNNMPTGGHTMAASDVDEQHSGIIGTTDGRTGLRKPEAPVEFCLIPKIGPRTIIKREMMTPSEAGRRNEVLLTDQWAYMGL